MDPKETRGYIPDAESDAESCAKWMSSTCFGLGGLTLLTDFSLPLTGLLLVAGAVFQQLSMVDSLAKTEKRRKVVFLSIVALWVFGYVFITLGVPGTK